MGKKCISIVVPMYNEQESLQILYRELNRVTREMGDYDFEYLFVNDGSKDATLQKIRELAAEDERVHYLSFSRNFGKEAALLAGLSCAKGDYVTTMDADLQDPPSLLPQMAAMLEAGDCDNVATRRVNRQGEPKIRSFFARMFYKVMRKLSHIEIADIEDRDRKRCQRLPSDEPCNGRFHSFRQRIQPVFQGNLCLGRI